MTRRRERRTAQLPGLLKFVQAPTWAMFNGAVERSDGKRLSPSSKLLYGALVGHGWRDVWEVEDPDSGESKRFTRAWPALNTLADELGIGVDAVRDAIRQLQDVGFIRVERQRGPAANRGKLKAKIGENEPTSNMCVVALTEPYPPESRTFMFDRGSSIPDHSGRKDLTTRVKSTRPHEAEELEEEELEVEKVWESAESKDLEQQLLSAENSRGQENLTPPSGSVEDEFDKHFWPAYPKKENKPAARSAFTRVRLVDGVELGSILTGLERRVRYGWDVDDERFIPNGSTWLLDYRWEDELDLIGAGA